MAALARASVTLRLVFLFAAAGPVIDFLEELVVLLNLRVVRIELERPLVGLARLFELPFVLVRNREIVEGRRIARIELGGFLPAVDRFAPEPALRDVDAEFDLRL